MMNNQVESNNSYCNVLSKKDITYAAIRWQSGSQLSWSYSKMMAPGFLYSIYPCLEKIYGDDKEGLKESVETHINFFNTNPMTGNIIVGIALGMEEQGKSEILPAVDGIKTGLMGPFAGVGDTIFGVILTTIFGSIAAYMALEGSWIGLFIWVVVLISIAIYRIKFTQLGYLGGTKLITEYASKLQNFTTAAIVLGLVVIGGLIPTIVKANLNSGIMIGEVPVDLAAMEKNLYVNLIMKKLEEVASLEQENIDKAAFVIATQIMDGGILQAFGSGHSYAAAIEICGRAGGLIPSKLIEEPSKGIYEMVEGVGEQFVKISDFRKEDVIVLISNSGRNPLSIEIAKHAKEKGAKIIVLTALEESKKLTSRHSSGMMLYEFADVVLNNHSIDGDAAIELVKLDVKTGGTSSLTGALILNEVMVRAIQIMIDNDFIPPIFKSANVDGGPEYNEKLLIKYAERLYRK